MRPIPAGILLPVEHSSIFRDDLLKGKVALVSGGGSGIGYASASELARLGATIVLCGRREEKIQAARTGMEEQGAVVHAKTCDIREVDQVEAWVDFALEKAGRIDVLVNNAGGQFSQPAIDFRKKGWDAVINTNLNGTWYVTQTVANKWMVDHGGKIINIVACMWRGMPSLAHTGAARAAVVNLTKSLSVEWAQYGIRINCVAPGIIEGSGFTTYPEDIQARMREKWRKVPLKRFGREEEIAWAVAFLASPAGDYFTGSTLSVDGGHAHWGDTWSVPNPAD